MSPTNEGGICVAAEDDEELGGEPLRLEEAVTAGRMSGGGGWLCGALLWRGRV